MRQTGTQLGHLVHLVDTLPCQEVQSVEVLLVAGEEQFAVRLLDTDDRLEDGALTLLDPLSHGVEVGGEVARGGEDALLVFSFALSVELLPPLTDEVELRLVVHHDLYLLAGSIEPVSHGSILCGDVLLEGHVGSAGTLHLLCALHQSGDVETGAGDGQQSHGGKHGESAAHVVGDDEALVALLVGTGAGSTLAGIRHGDDDAACLVLTPLLLTLFLQQAEGQGRLRRCSRLRDIDDAELLVAQIFRQLREIVLADVVAGEEDHGVALILTQPAKRVAQCLNDGTCT